MNANWKKASERISDEIWMKNIWWKNIKNQKKKKISLNNKTRINNPKDNIMGFKSGVLNDLKYDLSC